MNNCRIDPALVPEKVCSREGVGELNGLLSRLETRKVTRITLPEAENGFRTSNYIRVYCQANLRRCLGLLESAYGLFFTENGLASLICVRAIYETVASFIYFERNLNAKIEAGDLVTIHEFVRKAAHFTRENKLVSTYGKEVEAVNILTQIEKLKSLRPKVREEYDFLSEFAHPNSWGSFHYFASNPDDNDVVTFSDCGQDPLDDLKWVMIGAHMLTHLEQSLVKIDELLSKVSQIGRNKSSNYPRETIP